MIQPVFPHITYSASFTVTGCMLQCGSLHTLECPAYKELCGDDYLIISHRGGESAPLAQINFIKALREVTTPNGLAYCKRLSDFFLENPGVYLALPAANPLEGKAVLRTFVNVTLSRDIVFSFNARRVMDALRRQPELLAEIKRAMVLGLI